MQIYLQKSNFFIKKFAGFNKKLYFCTIFCKTLKLGGHNYSKHSS